MNLSNKIETNRFSQYEETILVKDVKEFIKELKTELECVYKENLSPEDILKFIDKLAGDRLI